MTKHWRRSRVTKALTDAGLVGSFEDAEARLDAVHVCVRVGADQAVTAAGQAAALTAVATAYKCFGRVFLAAELPDATLHARLPLGRTLGEAARALGATVEPAQGPLPTHIIQIGSGPRSVGWWVKCWWDRWLAGTRNDEGENLGESDLALAGIFAGALAVRQVFADVKAGASHRSSNVTISLWEPSSPADLEKRGPTQFSIPNNLWLVGLGHLGQAFVWTLLMLPYREPRRVVLQDDQLIAEENEATSLLVTGNTIGRRKARVASEWLETGGWNTQLIERRHRGDIQLTPEDPPILLAGLDALPPRIALAGVGFDYMVDVGIGHGAADFEGVQIRVIPKGAPIDGLWHAQDQPSVSDRLLNEKAYRAVEAESGICGKYMLAGASVAVPFVGAAAGALAIAQAIRLANLNSAVALLQMELASPELVIDGGEIDTPTSNLGGEAISLHPIAAQAGQ